MMGHEAVPASRIVLGSRMGRLDARRREQIADVYRRGAFNEP